MAVGGAALFSVDGLLIRLQALSPPAVLFWRSLFSCLAFAAAAVVAGKAIQPGTDPWRRSLGPIALLAGLTSLATVTFVFSLTHTAVAQTLVIGASVPIVTAIFGWLVLREHLPLRTWIAGAAALTGVLIVFGGSLGSVDFQGDLWALGTVLVSSILLISLRRYPNTNRLVLLAVSALAIAIVVAPWATRLPDTRSAIAALTAGLVTVPGASILISLAPRYIRAAEVGLALLLETVLGPIAVWVVVGEAPTAGIVISAAIIIGAIAVHSWLELREVNRSGAGAGPAP